MNRRKFVVGSSASLLAPALLRAYGQVPETSPQDRSYAEEIPHMLVSFLVSKLNRLAASWDGKRSLLRTAADVQKRNRVVREKLLSMLGEFPPRVAHAFDVFRPEVVKAATRAYPAAEIVRAEKDFTRINFGWIGYWAPGKDTIGTQPDMLEYVTSRAAAWECPIALQSDLQAMDAHPRTPDNLEVIRRWEDVRAQKWLTKQQKEALRDLDQEHILLVDEKGQSVLAPCVQIEKVAGADQPGRAFLFEHKGGTWITYWHTSGEATLQVALPATQMTLMKDLGKQEGGEETRTADWRTKICAASRRHAPGGDDRLPERDDSLYMSADRASDGRRTRRLQGKGFQKGVRHAFRARSLPRNLSGGAYHVRQGHSA